MATEVKVPSMGESISSGILASWHVSDGDTVERDQVLYELETDKITSEGMAEADGVITLKVEEGEEVEIGQVVATIEEGASGEDSDEDEEDETTEEADQDTSESEESEEEESTEDSTEKKASEAEEDEEDTDEEEEDKESNSSKKTEQKSSGKASAKLSPAVRALVDENDVDVSKVEGSGKDGRVTKGDVLSYLENQEFEKKSSDKKKKEKSASEKKSGKTEKPEKEKESKKEEEPSEKKDLGKKESSQPEPTSDERTTRKKLSPLRKRIGERLVSAQRQAAILTTFNEVDMSAIMNLRKTHQDAFVEKHGLKLGFMSFFCKAVVHALKEVPQVNAQIDGDSMIQNHYFDIGVAIGTERGLIVPVLRDVDQLSFAGVEKEIGRYANLAKEGKIQVEDLQGGVFTISNGGVYGSLLSTPILNPPQSGILGMHSIQQRPVAEDGEVVIRPMMYIALSYDHRLVDGKEAVTFLVKVKEAVENPTRLLFEI